MVHDIEVVYWHIRILFKQRLELLNDYTDAPTSQQEEAEREISRRKEDVKKYETEANERERKLNQLEREKKGLFWYLTYYEYHTKFN